MSSPELSGGAAKERDPEPVEEPVAEAANGHDKAERSPSPRPRSASPRERDDSRSPEKSRSPVKSPARPST